MDLIIVDGDCRNLWTEPELERLLDAKNDVVWFCEDAALRENKYNVAAAASAPVGASFNKGILLTRLQSGVMNYHRQMLRSTCCCKRWLIVIIDEASSVYRETYRNEVNSITEKDTRYEIIFDDSATMALTLEAKREIVDERLFCIIATKLDAKLAEDVQKTLEALYPDWRFECHVGMAEDSYKHADIVLAIGKKEADFALPPAKKSAKSIRIWLNAQRGMNEEERQEQEEQIIDQMNQCGWNLGVCRVWSSCLANEMLLHELDSGEIGAEALSTDDRFVMWDCYGLPLPARAYETADEAEAFLRSQCCFPRLLTHENLKEKI